MEKNSVVYQGPDGIYRKIWVDRDTNTGEFVVFRSTLWKGKKYAKPKEIDRSKHTTVLEWNGEDNSPPRIKRKIGVLESEVRSLLHHLCGVKWEKDESLDVSIAYYGNEVAEAIRVSGIARYQGMRQWLCNRVGDIVLLLDKSPISYVDARSRVFKQLENLLTIYQKEKE